MKLLLDEMISAVVAEQLKALGDDVEAVTQVAGLRGSTDDELFGYAQAHGRAVVTYNRDDFLQLDRQWRGQGLTHAGIVILNPKRFPQGAASVGPLVASLNGLVANGPPYESFIHWLAPAAEATG